ncbi:MAG: ferredoxin FdxA [Candidatus Nasuia deltocephalinicola]
MTHIVTEKCIKCKYTDCVPVCPVDCFHEGKDFLVINPDICIDCGVCIPECPVSAIITEQDLKNKDLIFLKINYYLSKIWPNILNIKTNNLNNKWKILKNKLHLIKI